MEEIENGPHGAPKTRYRLRRGEVLRLIDEEAQRRMKMSGSEFLERLRAYALSESVAKRDIQMLARLLGDKEENSLDLRGRISICHSCGTKVPSNPNLPFFIYYRKQDTDTHYCGCDGWDWARD